MKRIATLPFLIVIILIIYSSCAKDLPVLTTNEVSEISYNSATSGGEISDDGGADIFMRGICWNTSGSPTVLEDLAFESGGIGSFTGKLTHLKPSTSYYVRAFARNRVGAAYGNQVTFTTSELPVPVLTTSAITGITSSKACSGGNITDDRGSSITLRGVCWSTANNPKIENSEHSFINDGTLGNYVINLSGLTGNTTYYIRAYAANHIGVGYGDVLSFKTLSPVPTLTTTSISNVLQHTCISGGKITYDGGHPLEGYGVCWSTSPNPTYSDRRSAERNITDGSFTSTVRSLSMNTKYYIRAYAKNTKEIAYGNEITVTTVANPILFNSGVPYGNVTDIEGNTYKTIKLGSQVWMAENLKTQKYSNGDLIGTTVSPFSDITKESSAKYQWVFDNIQDNLPVYGRLYTWHAATDSRNVCPAGWHVPTLDEWLSLDFYIRPDRFAGGRLKEAGLIHWDEPNTGATNESGFTAIPGGMRGPWGGFFAFEYLGQYAMFWTSTEASTTEATFWEMYHAMDKCFSYPFKKTFGLSIRCLKD